MALKIANSIDLSGNQLIDTRVENLASLPSAGKNGRMAFVTGTQTLHFDNGTVWVQLSTATTIDWSSVTGKPSTFTPSAHGHPLAEISDMSAFIRTLADDADAAAARATLGLGTAATQASTAFAAASHVHDASAITSGTIDPARLPVLPSSVQIVSSGGIANLDAGQQSSIGDGSIITTTDGRRWVYTGSGSKTSEASYIEMADVTPDWSIIANKPATFTPSTHGHATSEITGLDTALAARTRKYAATGPSSSASSWAVTHSLGTQDVVVSVYDVASNDLILCDAKRTDANTVTLAFGSAQSANSLRIVVVG